MTNHSVISVINRAQVIDDALNLVEAGQLDYETALNLTRYLEHETDYIPWESALTGMEYISSMMFRTSGYGLLKKHLRTILTIPIYSLDTHYLESFHPILIQLNLNLEKTRKI